MKTTKEKLPIADPGCAGSFAEASCRLPIAGPAALFYTTIENRKSPIANRSGFTLIELLTVIVVMAVLASFTIVVLGKIKDKEYVNVASAELGQIESALENYKAKYGVYPPSNANISVVAGTNTVPSSTFPQLYYELSGVTNDGTSYVTLDGSAKILVTDVPKVFGVGGFINCYKGGGDEAAPPRNFLLGLRANQIGAAQGNAVATANLITSVRGPDLNYTPLAVTDVNPFRYQYPGSNNPSSYDLWVQLSIKGKRELVCNWSKSVIINSPLP